MMGIVRFLTASLAIVWGLFFLSGCGIGLNNGLGIGGVGDSGDGNSSGSEDEELGPRLVLSLASQNISKNDCYEVTVSAVDENSAPMTDITATVTLDLPTGTAAYEDLTGCQFYDSAKEVSSVFLTPAAPQATFILRADDTGTLNLGALASSGSGLGNGTIQLVSSFEPFSGASGVSGAVNAVIQDTSSGKLYIGGAFEYFTDRRVAYVARLNSDGTLDTSFLPTGSGLNAAVTAMALQSDGKLVVVGEFSTYDGTLLNFVARLNTDGSLDNSFGPTGTGVNNWLYAVAVQADGKILVGGLLTNYNGSQANRIMRLNADGSRDGTFAPTGTGVSGTVRAIVVQSDDKILIGGDFTTYNGAQARRVMRLNSDGTRDGGFTPSGTGLNDDVRAIALQTDDRIVLGGEFSSYNGSQANYIVRLNADGTRDGAFAPTGTGLDDDVYTVQLQADGKILAGGRFDAYNGSQVRYLIRLNTNGTHDTTLAPSADGMGARVEGMAVQSDGKIVAVGAFLNRYDTTAANRVVRINSDGSVDTGFEERNQGGGTNSHPLAEQSDGKILIGTSYYHGNDCGRVCRLNADGTYDSSFQLTGTGLDGSVTAITLQSDGKILVGGDFNNYNGAQARKIIRLNADGTRDGTFAPTGAGLGTLGPVNDVLIQTDGQIVVVGHFTTYNGAQARRIVRLNTDGTRDGSFSPSGSGLGSGVGGVVQQADGKLVIGGQFLSYNGDFSYQWLARLNTNGTIDGTFSLAGTGLNGAADVVRLQDDGKILAGGWFTNYNGTQARYIVRINTDGSLDTTFAPTGTGIGGFEVYDILVEPDGNILVAGDIDTYNGATASHIVRLYPDGTRHPSTPATMPAFSDDIYHVIRLSSGKFLQSGAPVIGTTYVGGFSRLTYNLSAD